MVKTRQQQAKQEKQEKQEQRSKNYETSVGVGVQTRSGTSKLERVELPTVVLSKEMNKRFQIKKAIAKNSRETVMERKLKKLFKYQRQYKEHRKQNNDEMLALWKNFNTAFTMIEGLYKFKDRVEDR
jgi:hypothetical protein